MFTAIVHDRTAAQACASCLLYEEVFAGVDDRGRLATVSEESTGESDYQAVWQLRVRRGTAVVCSAYALVEATLISYEVSGDRDCEALLGLGAKERIAEQSTERERVYRGRKIERTELITKVQARFSDALVPVPSPAGVGIEHVVDADGYSGELKQQPLTVDGVQVGHVTAGALRWAVTAYTHPRFGGVLFRMITLIGSPDQHLGSSSHCTDYYDGYLAVPFNRIEAARLIAKARTATTSAEALALASRAAQLDPSWSGAHSELRRWQRRTGAPH
jgi:hypothetical protein